MEVPSVDLVNNKEFAEYNTQSEYENPTGPKDLGSSNNGKKSEYYNEDDYELELVQLPENVGYSVNLYKETNGYYFFVLGNFYENN